MVPLYFILKLKEVSSSENLKITRNIIRCYNQENNDLKFI
jgi:hypothetical protein